MPVEFAKLQQDGEGGCQKINGIARADIEGICGYPGDTPFSEHWTFNGQTVNVSTSGGGWSPTGDMSSLPAERTALQARKQ